MGELFKAVWDVAVMRHYSREGMKLSAKDWVMAIGFVLLLYAIALPAALLYQNHPQYEWVLIAAMILDGILFVSGITWEIKWWIKHRAAALAASTQANRPRQ